MEINPNLKFNLLIVNEKFPEDPVEKPLMMIK